MLLSKLQIVELNEKDVRDIVHLLAALPLGGGAQASIDTDRFGKLLGADWGWWRTVTGNLAKLEELMGERPGLIPDNHAYEPVAQAGRLLELAVETPKSMKWKLRAATWATGSAGTSCRRKSHTEGSVLLDAGFPLVLHVAQSAR